MDRTIRINIQLGQSRYPLVVPLTEEPIYRQAARLINERLVAYNTKFRGAALPSETFMAMAALDMGVKCIKQSQQTQTEAAEADLEALTTELRQYLDNETL